MSILFVGSELADFAVSGSVVSVVPSDTTYSRAAILCMPGNNQVNKAVATFPASPEMWVKLQWTSGTVNTSSPGYVVIQLGNVLRVTGTGTAGTIYLQRYNGSSWVTVGSTVAFTTSLQTSVVLYAKLAAAGTIQLDFGGTLVTYTGDTSSLTPPDTLTLSGITTVTNTGCTFSEVIVASHNISQARLKTLAITGDGAVQQWSGSYTDIDAADEGDNSFISSDTADQVETFTIDNLAIDTLAVDAIVLSGRFRRSATGPQNLDGIVRIDGANYEQNIGTISESYTNKQIIWATDPSTSSSWGKATVDALEIGVKSKT